tara:strand:+ start:1623 stop:1787 length:165 start_codon:yes stop_codon:yes gene_type:complete
MTRAALLASMSSRELVYWKAFYVLESDKAFQAELARRAEASVLERAARRKRSRK